MRVIALVSLLALGCGGTKEPAVIIPMRDMAAVDSAAALVDMAKKPPSSVSLDLAVVDMAQPPNSGDMAAMMCAEFPSCGPPSAAAGCCNGAMTCINSLCQNEPGQPCNSDPAQGPIVRCWNGHAQGGPSGTCASGVCLE